MFLTKLVEIGIISVLDVGTHDIPLEKNINKEF